MLGFPIMEKMTLTLQKNNLSLALKKHICLEINAALLSDEMFKPDNKHGYSI